MCVCTDETPQHHHPIVLYLQAYFASTNVTLNGLRKGLFRSDFTTVIARNQGIPASFITIPDLDQPSRSPATYVVVNATGTFSFADPRSFIQVRSAFDAPFLEACLTNPWRCLRSTNS